MSETIKLCAMLARAVFENDDEAREPFVEQAMRAKREHDEMRRELAEARRAVDNIGDAYDRLVSAVVGGVASAAYCFDTSEYEKEAERLRAAIDASDDTRREWEARAATSYRDGLKEGLREAAGKHLELRPQVATFARAMERKLRANDHKGGWENESAQYLLSRLCEEVSELLELYDVDSMAPDKVGPREAFAIAVSYTRYAADALRRLKGTLPGSVRAKAGVESEAADVANFAMMIADVCGALAPPAAETVKP